MWRLILILAFIPMMAFAAVDTITVIEPQPTQITITSSTAPQVTVNTSGNDVLQIVVPGTQGPPGPAGSGGSGGGVTDHTLLTNIGTNTHAQIDTALTRLANTSGTNTGDQTNISGNAGTATTLATPRAIQGVSFDGSAAINPINGTGFVKAAGATLSYDNSTYSTTSHNHSGTYEPALGNPGVSGYMLTSTTGGVRSWTAPSGGVSDHTLLTNIGTNTHAAIDTALTRLATTSGTNTGDQTSVTGNAGTATVLATPRAIQGVNFDGSAAINPINGTGFVKSAGTTLSYDNTTYAPVAGPTFTGTASGVNFNGTGYLAAGTILYANIHTNNTGTVVQFQPWKQLDSASDATAGNAFQFQAFTAKNNVKTGGQQNFIYINPTYNQTTGTASNTDLLINRSGTVGSGEQLLIDAQLATVSKFKIDTSGNTTSAGSVLSNNATAGIGYTTGAGGTVTQGTSRTTGVTLSKATGAITLFSAAGTTTWQTFTVTNTAVAVTDNIIVSQVSGTDLYEIHVTNIAAGSFKITYRTTAGTTTEQPVFRFTVIKGVSA